MNMVWKYSVYSIFRKQKNRLQEKANRERNKEYFQKLEKHNALLELQTKTPLKEIKKFKQYNCSNANVTLRTRNRMESLICIFNKASD